MAIYTSAASYIKKLAHERDKQKNDLLYQSQARQMAAKQGVSAAMDSVARNSANNTNYRRGVGQYAGDGAGARQGQANTVRVKVGSDALQELEQANLDKLRTQQVDADYAFKTGQIRDARMGDARKQAFRRAVGQTWDEGSMSWKGAVDTAKLRKVSKKFTGY